MLGFITRLLVLTLGYAYPAFECYKTVEKNKVEIEELRFWCQYWIIAALLTILERIGDIFIAWVPLYGELKLALFIYLWYPKTKGSSYLYQSVLQPYVSKHETDIESKLLEFRARAWDLAIFYWQNCAEMGQETFFQILKFLAAPSLFANGSKKDDKDKPTPPIPPPNGIASFFSQPVKAPGKSSNIHRAASEPAEAIYMQVPSRSEPQKENLLTHASLPTLVTQDSFGEKIRHRFRRQK